ncbi:MAG: phenylalanine--tRNA ligase subunit beta [Paludibacteraceae bacterium]|nr:phenylalanine--tRNA ligase subunit beta [Paludibacteraceae bacterium]
MNISFNWLKQYIDLDINADETAKKLTSLGLEVDAVETVESIKGGLEGLVVAKVVECIDHPDSDHLHITKVDNGSGELIQVVCGAPNCRAGLKTIMATIGTKLYDGDNEFQIKKSKIRGVESFGMLCAEDEIGVGSSHAGIIELPDNVEVGMPAKDYYKIENDTLIEVDITPNRADAISHIGVARDLAAATGKKVNWPSVDAFKINSNSLPIKVTVTNSDACPRYCGISISGVTVKESPDWLKNRLTSIGLRPINNIVDVTNFILNEIGQPLHSFDADKIKGGEICVATVADGTKFTTLDGVERTLTSNDLMICNASEPMCIAGVFGGLDSGVTDGTKNVFIESAYFNPVWVRKTARRYGLNTDASFRYERGCDPNITIYALKRAALLIQEVAGGSIASEITDIYPTPIEDFKVDVTYKKINDLIGKEIDKDTIKSILNGLEIKIASETAEGLSLLVPPYRVDVKRDVDIIEDILRVYGYNNVMPGTSLKASISYSSFPDSTKLQNNVSRHLTGAGFSEILNNSLTKLSYYNGLTSYPVENAVRIMNPLGSDLSVMRQTLLFGGLESIARNRNRKRTNLKFYEFGECYHYNKERAGGEHPLAAYSEELHLCMWLSGNRYEQSWTDSERPLTFFDLKAHVLNILRRLGINPELFVEKPFESDIYSQALKIETKNGTELATLGIVAGKQLKAFDIDADVFYADINWKKVLKQIKSNTIKFADLPKYPEVKRDLALLLDKSVSFEEIENLAYQVERKLLKRVVLFDVYEGKNIEEGKKSYAVNFTLQDTEKTLEDRQIDGIMQRLIKTFQDKLGATIR